MKIFIADEHVLFRESLVSLLDDQPDIEVIGEAGQLNEAVKKILRVKPDIVLMEARFLDGEVPEAVRWILGNEPGIAVVIFTDLMDDELFLTVLRNGARGYLLKQTSKPKLLDALRGIQRGEPALTRMMMGKVLDEYARISKLTDLNQHDRSVLTYREVEVLNKIAAGASNREIAAELSISENTVRVHVRNILDKLHLRNRFEAGDYARRTGLTLSSHYLQSEE